MRRVLTLPDGARFRPPHGNARRRKYARLRPHGCSNSLDTVLPALISRRPAIRLGHGPSAAPAMPNTSYEADVTTASNAMASNTTRRSDYLPPRAGPSEVVKGNSTSEAATARARRRAMGHPLQNRARIYP